MIRETEDLLVTGLVVGLLVAIIIWFSYLAGEIHMHCYALDAGSAVYDAKRNTVIYLDAVALQKELKALKAKQASEAP